MRRTNLAREFARLQSESKRAVEILGQVMAELAPKRVDDRRPSQVGPLVQPTTVVTYSKKILRRSW
jgi:hypothetical protein